MSIILHGECVIRRTSIPAEAQPLARTAQDPEGARIVAASETVGNHHVIDEPEGVSFYVLDGVRYMRATVPTAVRCVHPDRHSTIEIEPGEYSMYPQQEYDHFANRSRAVQD